MDTFKNFVVGYTFAQSAHGLKEIVAISRISNSDGARDCVWFHGIDLVRSLLKSVDNWGTAGGLSRINLVAGIFDQTDFDQFLESLLRASVESFHPHNHRQFPEGRSKFRRYESACVDILARTLCIGAL